MTKKELKQIINIEEKQIYLRDVLKNSRYDEDDYEYTLKQYLKLEEQRLRIMYKLG